MLRYLFYGTALSVLAGCAVRHVEIERVASPELGRDFTAFTAPAEPLPREKTPVPVRKTLSVREALALTLLHGPELAAYAYEIRAREALELQAGVLPNPEAVISIENFGGETGFNGTNAAETTLLLGQHIELGGKRAKRMRVAAFDTRLAEVEYETKKLDVLTGAAKTFVQVLAAQESLGLLSELVDLSQKVKNAVGARVEAGKVSPIELMKAEVALSSTQLQWEQGKRVLAAKRSGLAAFWGGAADFERVTGSLYETGPLPSLDLLQRLIEHNPDVSRWRTETARGQAILDLAKTGRVPDLTVQAGIRQLRVDDVATYVVGLSIPLPIFDRNQGTIRHARYQILKTEAQSASARNNATASLNQSYQNLSTALGGVLMLKQRILPAATLAFDAVNEGYQEGKFGFLDVLDAQRTLFAAKGQYIEVLTDYHLFKTDVERLIGKPLTSISEVRERGDEN